MIIKSPRVKTGLDIVNESSFAAYRNKRVALLGHPASVDANLNHLYDLCRLHNVNVVKLFGPEHGFFGSAQDMESVDSAWHDDIPVISLYGESRKSLMLDPTLLSDVDVLICDLQDIGARYYTFSYTIAFALHACEKANVRCVVLDRPNPINAEVVRGNLVKHAFQSFVGEYPLPMQTGLTMGELAHFFKEHDNLEVDLEVVWMQNYNRQSYFDETGLPWVLPSPNMPSLDTALIYPGLCMIEGTNLSEGRGTTRPFELVGAPYVTDPTRFAERAMSHGLEGVHLRPCWFKPMFQKHANQMCGGVQIHILDRSKLDSVRLAICMISAARDFEGFDWRREPYEFVSDRLAIDLLFGDDQPRKNLEGGHSPHDIMAYLNESLPAFLKTRASLMHTGYAGGSHEVTGRL